MNPNAHELRSRTDQFHYEVTEERIQGRRQKVGTGTARDTPVANRANHGNQRVRSLGVGIRNRDLLRNLICRRSLTFRTKRSRVYTSLSHGPGRGRSCDRQPGNTRNWSGCVGGPSRRRHRGGTCPGSTRAAAVAAQEKARVRKVESQLGQKVQSQTKDRTQLADEILIVASDRPWLNSTDTGAQCPTERDQPNRYNRIIARTSSLEFNPSR